jgi:hypothetical protein
MSEECYQPPTTTLPRGLTLPRQSTLRRITILERNEVFAPSPRRTCRPILDNSS